ERGGNHERDSGGSEERQPDRLEGSARGWDQSVGEEDREEERERGREQNLGREPEREPEQHAEPPREPPSADLNLNEAHDRESHERQQEHRRRVHVSLQLAEHVTREPEQVPSDERRPERPGQVTAEDVSRPRRDGRQEQLGGVEGRGRAEERSQRREEERQPRDARRPDEVDAGGGVDRMAVERVLPRLERVEPPGERPHKDLRVSAVTEQVAARMTRQPGTEEREREQDVAA